MSEQGRTDGTGEGRELSPRQQKMVDRARRAIEEHEQELLARLEETDDAEERRALEEELANLPRVLVSMKSVPITELKGGDL